MKTEEYASNRPKPVSIIDQLLIVKHALYDGEIRLAQDTVDELIQKLKAI